MATLVNKTDTRVTLTLTADEVVLLERSYQHFTSFNPGCVIVARGNTAGTPQISDNGSDWEAIDLADDSTVTRGDLATYFRLNGDGGNVTFKAI